MDTYTTTTYDLSVTDRPLVVSIKEGVYLQHQSWIEQPQPGFSIFFLPMHLPIIRDLCAALERLDTDTPMLTIDLDEPLTGKALADAIEDELARLGWATAAFTLPPPGTAFLFAFPTTKLDVIRLEDEGDGCCVHGAACLTALRALQAPITYEALWDFAITPYRVEEKA
mgnify:CR=1 FL=1